MRVLRSAIVVVGLAAALLTGPSCFTPTLPIPPPIIEALSAPDADGIVHVRVTMENANPDSTDLYVRNQRTGLTFGGPRLPSGAYAYDVAVFAASGDCLIAYEVFQVYEISQGTTCQSVR
jgi:hypothetical protein